MNRELATKVLIGISGLAIGMAFVLTLRGAAIAAAERLQTAHARSAAVVTAASAAANDSDINTSARRTTSREPR